MWQSDGWHRQFQKLKEAVLLLLVFKSFHEDRQEPNILTRVAEEHAKRRIPAAFYPRFAEVLIDCIIAADAHQNGLGEQRLRSVWSNVVKPGVDYMKHKAEEFEQSRYMHLP